MKKKTKIIIGILIAAVIAAAGITWYVMNQKNQKTGNSSAEVVAWDVDIEEEEPSEEKGILIPGYTSMVMKANTKEQTVSIGNPADNDCIFVIVLKLEDGTKLFESQELKPGEGLENITLDQELEAGEYQAVIEYNGNAYGTTKKSVEEARARGKNVILDVDTIGAMKIRALCPDATLIYILPPSWDELKSRLSSTGIYTEEEVNALMEIAEEEISCANSYDYILVNDTISNTLSRFAQIIHSNRYSRNCMKEFLDSYIDGEVKPHVQSYKEALL